MANLRVDSIEYLPGSLGVFFSNDVDIKVTVDPLLDDFRSDSVILLLFPSLSSCDGVSSKSIHYISDLFLLEHCLGKVGSLKPVLKAAELLFHILAVVVFVSHLTDFNNLVKDKNIILVSMHTSDLIT